MNDFTPKVYCYYVKFIYSLHFHSVQILILILFSLYSLLIIYYLNIFKNGYVCFNVNLIILFCSLYLCLNFLEKSTGLLHDFIQLKLLAPDAVKKCQRINNDEKNGQTIQLDQYNSR